MVLFSFPSDPVVFNNIRIQQTMINDTATKAQNLVEILHCIKKFYQVCLVLAFNVSKNTQISWVF